MSVSPRSWLDGEIARLAGLGTGRLGREAVQTLARFAGRSKTTGSPSISELRKAAARLALARPASMALRHALNHTLSGYEASGQDAQWLEDAAHQWEAQAVAARNALAERAHERLGKDETILTHCYSTAVCQVLEAAKVHGKRVQVLATETRPFRQGLWTAAHLARAGIPVTFVADAAAMHVMREESVTQVWTGADMVTHDGQLVNKVGTWPVALAARELKIPVLVAAEAHKLQPPTWGPESWRAPDRSPSELATSADLPPGVRVRNPGYDATPPELITSYVTEEADVAPDQVADYAQAKWGSIPDAAAG